LTGVPRDLLEAASKVIDNAYAPYSGLRVASAVRGGSGKIYVGVNVENASYGLTICAERAAVFSAVTNGERVIREVLVLSDSNEPIPPCGACRQVIAEFAAPDTMIYSVSLRTGRYASWRLRELLPYAFTLKEGQAYGSIKK
jgi:cytidine deaminase